MTSAADTSAQAFSAEIMAKGDTTFPWLLAGHVRVRPNRAAIREKYLGIWQTLTWSEFDALAREFAGGLAECAVPTHDMTRKDNTSRSDHGLILISLC
jgi:long-chain acyl-CoA synthetase